MFIASLLVINVFTAANDYVCTPVTQVMVLDWISGLSALLMVLATLINHRTFIGTFAHCVPCVWHICSYPAFLSLNTVPCSNNRNFKILSFSSVQCFSALLFIDYSFCLVICFLFVWSFLFVCLVRYYIESIE